MKITKKVKRIYRLGHEDSHHVLQQPPASAYINHPIRSQNPCQGTLSEISPQNTSNFQLPLISKTNIIRQVHQKPPGFHHYFTNQNSHYQKTPPQKLNFSSLYQKKESMLSKSLQRPQISNIILEKKKKTGNVIRKLFTTIPSFQLSFTKHNLRHHESL